MSLFNQLASFRHSFLLPPSIVSSLHLRFGPSDRPPGCDYLSHWSENYGISVNTKRKTLVDGGRCSFQWCISLFFGVTFDDLRREITASALVLACFSASKNRGLGAWIILDATAFRQQSLVLFGWCEMGWPTWWTTNFSVDRPSQQ